MKLKETFRAWGHPNIRATHRTTLEITREEHLTLRGDCIVAVRSEKSVADLDPKFKQMIMQDSARITLVLKVLGIEDTITGFGHEKLMLTSQVSMVCRKSSYICPRTLMIRADKSAIDIDRELIEYLRQGKQVEIAIEVEV
ncbi:MAG: DUF371 domain-containing protein [Candidatus Nezhaarchaeota archaeon]|nr:DUF371 domain-containing protein [Candidatus Nezhaarchaeota archaeon]MCX8141731.1 DUF371 domain-containing protein [Candidatus Nezhaarchaeota archaeon]MDW8050491.1 DUF371 domain-containing protein [Nitrososphaerota archaeon]